MTRLCFSLVMMWFLLVTPGSAAPSSDSLTGTLTLPNVFDFAMTHSPEVSAARFEVKVREGAALQARLLSNPELEAEVENLDANGAFKEENRVITTRLRQTLDFSQIPRTSMAHREKELAQLELMAIQRRARARIRKEFVSVLSAQERIVLAVDLGRLASAAHSVAVEKVKAGKAPPTDSLQSFVALSMARIDSGKGVDELNLTRRALASACGLAKVSFDSAEGRLGPAKPVPDWEALSIKLMSSPDWNRNDLEAKVSEAEIKAEKTMRLPAISLEAGIQQVPEQNGRAFVAGISLPIPIWNRNQGAIRSAQARKAKIGEEGKSHRLDLAERLAGIHALAASSYRESEILEKNILPAATSTFEGAQEAYRVGKFGSLDALNAQRALFEARAQYLSALTTHHLAVAEFEELLGMGQAYSGTQIKP